MNDWYICIMRGGFISSVTIVDEQYAENTVKQFRNRGLSVKVFKDMEKYKEFCKENDEKYQKNVRLMREAMM